MKSRWTPTLQFGDDDEIEMDPEVSPGDIARTPAINARFSQEETLAARAAAAAAVNAKGKSPINLKTVLVVAAVAAVAVYLYKRRQS